MLRSYIKIAARNLLKYKFYSAINVAGLAIGLAACLLLALYVQGELSYDRHHSKAERIYRIAQDSTRGDRIAKHAAVSALLGPALAEHVSAFARVARLMKVWHTVVHCEGQLFIEKRFYRADAAVFDLFDYRWLSGEAATALAEPYSLVLTSSVAQKYFGAADPVGQTLSLDMGNGKVDYRVTGLIEDLPGQTHLHFDALISPHNLSQYALNWGAHSAYVYALLPAGHKVEDWSRQLRDFAAEHVPGGRSFFPQPLLDIHLHSDLQGEAEVNGDVRTLYLFSAIALAILLVACVNFVNLSTARAGQRAREVGLRKVLGAMRGQLVQQFLGEAALMTVAALLLALGLVEGVLPFFNEIFARELQVHYAGNWLGWGACAAFALGVSVLAGGYAALVLSSFKPVRVLQGERSAGHGGSPVREGLVILQFAVSIALMVSAAIVSLQLRYAQEQELGFDREHLLLIDGAGWLGGQYEAFKNELLSHADVLAVSTGNAPIKPLGLTQSITREGETVHSLVYDVDYDFVATLGLKIVAGRDFSPQVDGGDGAREIVLVNETFARTFSDGEAGEFISRFSDGKPVEVIGVVADFHMRSLREEIQPVVLRLRPQTQFFVLARLRPQHLAETLEFVEETWRTFVPAQPFSHSFLDAEWENLYRSEEQMSRLVNVFSALAVFVACIGLFGLAAFSAERRTKEIGIRKVLGASVVSVMLLLSKEFARPVLWANALAWPLAYWAANHWLEAFVYRINLGLGVFAAGGVLALLLALLMINGQALKVALSDPVKALRCE